MSNSFFIFKICIGWETYHKSGLPGISFFTEF
jgi:hypothetical protein